MATTPNYGWVTPAPTDFVTDLPADFETFADAVDADLAGLLGGTTGQILTKDSNTDHDFSWQSPSAGGGYTLLSTTSLSGATTSITGISQDYLHLYVEVEDFYPSVDATGVWRINADTGSNYRQVGYTTSGSNSGSTYMFMVSDINNASSNRNVARIMFYNYTNSKHKLIEQDFWAQEASAGATINHWPALTQYTSTSAISQLNFIADNFTAGATWSGGTVRIYGVN